MFLLNLKAKSSILGSEKQREVLKCCQTQKELLIRYGIGPINRCVKKKVKFSFANCLLS